MKTGIHKITMAEYLALKAVSSGVLHTLIERSPLHARINSPWNDNRKDDAGTEADIGSAAHKCLLEGVEDGIQIIDADSYRTNAAKELRDTAHAEGRIPMLIGKMPAVRAMADAAREYVAASEIAGIFDRGEPEVTLVWTHLGEILCKARADYLTTKRDICLSYKTTTGSANPASWIRTQLPQYDMATVFYERGVLAACDVEQCRVVHLVQEQSFPYSCSLVALDPAYRALADSRLDLALSMWGSCEATGKWPAYSGRIAYAEPKAWQLDEHPDMLTTDELSGGIPA